jgi:hypothetical protein
MANLRQLRKAQKAISLLHPREIITPTNLRKLYSKIIISKDGCWEWQGARSAKDYGVVSYNKTIYFSHRLFYKLFKGELISGYQICHHCDNPCCVNPDHLFIGTNKDNVQDCIRKGRRSQSFEKKHIAHNASLTKEEAEKIVTFAALNPLATSTQISEKFKISKQLAKDVKRGRSYGNLIEHFEEL